MGIRQSGLSTIDDETVASFARSLPNFSSEIVVPVTTANNASNSSADSATGI